MILSDIATFVTDKIKSTEISLEEYVTTDSLLQNKKGRRDAESLPPSPCNLTLFKSGDVLISNIRPYLKKIWRADSNGACSTDVLVFRAKEDHNPLFLYALLLQDAFYEYVMKAPKGSKMPRGDQDHIMRFPILQASNAQENEIGSLFENIQRKIQLNEQVIEELQKVVEELYTYWFVQFDFPDAQERPYKSNGGRMKWNESIKQYIPEKWDVAYLKDISSIKNTSKTPNVTPESIFLHYSIPAFDDWVYPAREYGKDIESNKYVVSEDCILVSKLNPQFKRIWKPVSVSPNSVCSTEFMPFISTNPERIGYLYGVLNSDAFYIYMVQCSSSSTGSRKRMGPELCGDFRFATPTDSGEKVVQKFSDYAIETLIKQGQLREEIQRLIALREYLLPVVMTRRFLI